MRDARGIDISIRKEHDMAQGKPQPNTMDEPGGPEAPLASSNAPERETHEGSNQRKDKARQGAPTDPDFEPPVVPGDTNSTTRK
jgi:hypothetical protein